MAPRKGAGGRELEETRAPGQISRLVLGHEGSKVQLWRFRAALK